MDENKLKSFKDLKVWQKSSELAILVYEATEKFPNSELYGLTNQIRRATVSISSNVAEGFKRKHKKEKIQFYNVAYSSAAEVESQIEISYKLGYLNKQDYKNLADLTIEVAKMTDGLIKSVRRRPTSKLGGFIFFLTLYSISYILSPVVAQGATLYLLPSSHSLYQQDTFIVDVRLDTQGDEINSIKGDLVFPSDLFEFIDFNDGDSILSLWPQTPIAGQGTVNFVGGTTKGFLGDGSIVKLIFRSKNTGQGIIDFADSSKVLLNDGKATEAELNFLEGLYSVIEKPEGSLIISSRSHPDQNKWYSNSYLNVKWPFSEDSSYSYILSYDVSAEPDNIPDKPEGDLMWLGEMTYPDLGDGIYYFHLKETKDGVKWGPKTTFRAMIDTEKPEAFEAKISHDESLFDGKYFLSFSTTDSRSGIDHYEVLETEDKRQETGENENWVIAESPYLLQHQNLQSAVKVKAVDRAGNVRIFEIEPETVLTEKPTFYWLLIIIPVVGIIWWIYKKRQEARDKRQGT